MAEAADCPLPSAAAPDLSEAQATSDSITSRMGQGDFYTAARNTARGKGTAGWKVRGTGRSEGKICCCEGSLLSWPSSAALQSLPSLP